MAFVCAGLALNVSSPSNAAELTQSFSITRLSWRGQPRHGCPHPSSSIHRNCRSPFEAPPRHGCSHPPSSIHRNCRSPFEAPASSSASSSSSAETMCPPRRKKKIETKQLFSMGTPFNEITVLDIPHDSSSEFAGSRLLLLDESGNVHSIYREESKWTNAYWDQFATLPPIVPDGPIAILGLGGGTSARLMLDLWPSCKLLGWEIDETLVDVARDYFGLSELETPTSEGGILEVRLDDALEPSATVEGGFAGIIVDLFADGEVIPQLQEAEVWFELKRRLKDGGRIMINCGGICVEKSDSKSELDDGTWTWEDGGYAKEATLRAMVKAFPQTLYRRLGGESDNYMALTGPLPDLVTWGAALPPRLQKGLTDWRRFNA